MAVWAAELIWLFGKSLFSGLHWVYILFKYQLQVKTTFLSDDLERIGPRGKLFFEDLIGLLLAFSFSRGLNLKPKVLSRVGPILSRGRSMTPGSRERSGKSGDVFRSRESEANLPMGSLNVLELSWELFCDELKLSVTDSDITPVSPDDFELWTPVELPEFRRSLTAENTNLIYIV